MGTSIRRALVFGGHQYSEGPSIRRDPVFGGTQYSEGTSIRRAPVFGGTQYSEGPSIRRDPVFGGHQYSEGPSIRRAPVFGGHQYSEGPSIRRDPVFGGTQYSKGTRIRRDPVFGTSKHYRKTHGSLLSGWMNCNYTACCWLPTSSNVLILPSQFWQIRFESYWLHCSECWILVPLRYMQPFCVQCNTTDNSLTLISFCLCDLFISFWMFSCL